MSPLLSYEAYRTLDSFFALINGTCSHVNIYIIYISKSIEVKCLSKEYLKSYLRKLRKYITFLIFHVV